MNKTAAMTFADIYRRRCSNNRFINYAILNKERKELMKDVHWKTLPTMLLYLCFTFFLILERSYDHILSSSKDKTGLLYSVKCMLTPTAHTPLLSRGRCCISWFLRFIIGMSFVCYQFVLYFVLNNNLLLCCKGSFL